ncbi:MAG: hypothetical protein ABW292_09190 [Vicinamibacterales bacterium]
MPDGRARVLSSNSSGRRASYSYVILVSALKGKSSYLQGMAAGADDFIGILPTCM